VDELCAECVGCGVVKGSSEEEQELEQQRQRNREEWERKEDAAQTRLLEARRRWASEEKARRAEQERTAKEEKARRLTLSSGRVWKAQMVCARSKRPVSQVKLSRSTMTTYKVQAFEVSFDLRKDEVVHHTCPGCGHQFLIGTRSKRDRTDDELDIFRKIDNNQGIIAFSALIYTVFMLILVIRLAHAASSADPSGLSIAGHLVLIGLSTLVFGLSLNKRIRLLRSAKALLPDTEKFWRKGGHGRHVPYQFAIGSSDAHNHYLSSLSGFGPNLGNLGASYGRAWSELPSEYGFVNLQVPGSR
jgi:hypothetical protein